MNRIERSQKKYEELFLNPQTLDLKDPEFMTQLQRLIFGEVFYVGDLTDRQRELITFCFLVAQGGCEAQLSSHIIGFPRTFNALKCIQEIQS